MAKTTVQNFVNRVKRSFDYNITDTDLDTLILDFLNDALQEVKQLFFDYGLLDEITASDSFSTVASTAYVDIATETADLDEIIVLYEKTNDKVIEIIPYDEFVVLYPDSAADSATTPDHAARFLNRIYFGPTPNSIITIYMDYIKLITVITAVSGSLPFEDKFDPIISAITIEGLGRWMNPSDAISNTLYKARAKELKESLIANASKNVGMNRQTGSRRPSIPYFAPKKVIS